MFFEWYWMCAHWFLMMQFGSNSFFFFSWCTTALTAQDLTYVANCGMKWYNTKNESDWPSTGFTWCFWYFAVCMLHWKPWCCKLVVFSFSAPRLSVSFACHQLSLHHGEIDPIQAEFFPDSEAPQHLEDFYWMEHSRTPSVREDGEDLWEAASNWSTRPGDGEWQQDEDDEEEKT